MISIYEPEGLTFLQLEFGKQYLMVTNAANQPAREEGNIVMITSEHLFYLRAQNPERYGKSFEHGLIGKAARFVEISLSTDLTVV